MATPRGTRITELRQQRGWSRRDLAEAAGISWKHLYGIETGFNRAKPEVLYRVAAALNTTIDEVMVRIDNSDDDSSEPTPERKANPTSHPEPPRPVPPPKKNKPPRRAPAAAAELAS